jgi:MscS family membrane protein
MLCGKGVLRHYLAIVACLLVPGITAGLLAQVPGVPSPSAAAATAPEDPLGRDSPFSTVTQFSNAVRRNDFSVAGRYLQTDERSAQDIENLARDLSNLLDRYFTASLTSLSRVPSGDLADGLQANLERVPLTIGNRPIDLFLTRVNDPDTGLVWLFASDSLAGVPTLHRSPAATWVERVMPASLVARTLRGISLAQWILWAASIVLPLLLLWLSAVVVAWMAKRRIADLTRRAVFLLWWNGVRWLLVVGLTLIAHLGVMPLLGFSLTFRHTYVRIGLIVTIVVAALLVWRLVSVTFHQAGLLAMRRGRSGTRSLIQFAERVVKVMVVLIAVFGLLALGGVDATTALAGVGIAGVAVALGAQKSVENLLGGIFLLTDRVLAVGDFCRLSDRAGWVEDVTLRSVRLRTLEQTLLSVPAGVLAQGSIENFATRGKILAQSMLRLRYGTSSEQLQTVLDGTRQLLATHPSTDKESARIRLIAFGQEAIELELFAYITTSDFSKFLEIRESLLLQVARIVESSGSAFAMPTQFIHMRSDADDHRPSAGVQMEHAVVTHRSTN